jgi:predicted ribosomally synthesized peptide with SipW-like signal peptide
MNKILKSILVMSIALGTGVVGTGAFFTSNVQANNNQIVVGTLRLAIDSSRTHTDAWTWNGGTGPQGAPFDSYIVAYDNGAATTFQQGPLETWQNAAPGTYVPYVEVTNGGTGYSGLQDGNYSWWISLRNAGSINMKAKADVTGGTWTADPALTAVNATCTDAYLNANSAGVITVPKVTVYGTTGMTNICKGDKECQNIYYGLTGLTGWHYSTDPIVAGSDISIAPTGTVYLTSDLTAAGTDITLKPQEFVIARVDANFNTSDNCFQGATYHYNLNGSAYQMSDTSGGF